MLCICVVVIVCITILIGFFFSFLFCLFYCCFENDSKLSSLYETQTSNIYLNYFKKGPGSWTERLQELTQCCGLEWRYQDINPLYQAISFWVTFIRSQIWKKLTSPHTADPHINMVESQEGIWLKWDLKPVSSLGHLIGIGPIELPTNSGLARVMGMKTVLAGVLGSKKKKVPRKKRKGFFFP